jgi:hypothetical protein
MIFAAPVVVGAAETAASRPSKSILKKSDVPASKSPQTVETLSVSGGHKLLWRPAGPAAAATSRATDPQVKAASANEPAAGESTKPLRRPTSSERAKRRQEILRVESVSRDDGVQQAAHLQPLVRPRTNAAAPSGSDSIEEILGEAPANGDTQLPGDEITMPGDETAPAAPADMPGDDSTDTFGNQPNGIQDTNDDPFKDDRIPNNMDEDQKPEQFELEHGNKGATGTEGCEDDKQECRESYRLIKQTTLNRISLDINISGVEGQDFPCECEIGNETFAGRNWSCLTYNWTASAMCHKPLYFEEPDLERYGHSWNPLVQPIVSGAHFFATFPVLPYKMGLTPPQECIYSLGYYRPGNCAPYLLPPIPFSLRAAAVEAAAVGGAIAIIP